MAIDACIEQLYNILLENHKEFESRAAANNDKIQSLHEHANRLLQAGHYC